MELKLIVVAVFFCSVCGFSEAQMVTPLNSSITATSCGLSKLCMTVDGCDPAGNSSCFFSSTQFTNPILTVEITGNTSGYVALGLTSTVEQIQQLTKGAVVFVCGINNTNNNDTAFFETAIQNGSVLTPATVTVLNITTVQASVNATQRLVRCTFNITLHSTLLSVLSNVVIGTVKLPFNVTILTGDTNGTALGNATTVFQSNGPLDLADPRSNIPTPVPVPPPLSITRDGCNVSKLCLSSPSSCDPAGNSDCFFNSVRKVNDAFFFELSGTKRGYVALGLTKNASTIVFICANESTSGKFFFEKATKINNSLILKNVSTIHSFQGEVSQNKSLIQCIFNTSITYTIKAEDSKYQVTILSGDTNGTQLGDPNVLFESNGPLDLSDPKATGSSHKLIASLCTNVLAVLLGTLTLRLL